jgi:Binding-protein-dependent transport system inner membrane component/N-terminal TM domain of oligopeptide transport permease C
VTLNLPPEPVPLPPRPAAATPLDSPLTGLATVPSDHEGAAVVAPGMLPAGKPRSAFRRSLDVFLENKLAVTGVAIMVAMFAFCFLGPFFYHTDQIHVNLANEDMPPGAGHPLGTDAYGYDILGRLMSGGQISLQVGLAAAALATIVGVLWGAVAGYFGGVLDSVMMRIVDALLSIPTLFLALVVVAILQPTEEILILVIALTSRLTTSRLVRGEALSLRVREYVQAMKVMGGSGAARGAAAHRAQRDRDDHGERDLPGGRRHRPRRHLELSGAGRFPAADGLGCHAQQRHPVLHRWLLVGDRPSRVLHHHHDHRSDLHQ